MPIIDQLEEAYPDRVCLPETVQDIPARGYMVYILAFNQAPIVLGHGTRSRAKVIFDDLNQITSGHIKAMFVRAYWLFGEGIFERFIVTCQDKREAGQVERALHEVIGGNNRVLPPEIMDAMFINLQPGTVPYMVLQMAMCSSFSGISDLTMWRRKGILDDATWDVLGDRLKLPDPL